MKLSEDWLATGIGLLIVIVIGLGLLGPGPLETRLNAPAGETVQTDGRAVDGWTISATLDGGSTEIQWPGDEPLRRLSTQTIYRFVCVEGGIAAAAPEFDTASYLETPSPLLILDNQCAAPVTLTLRRAYAIRWPLFDLFAR